MTHPLPTGAGTPPANRRRLFAVASVAMFAFGSIIALLGTLFGLPETRERLGIDLAQQGQLFGILSFGMLVSSLIVGPMIDRFGSKPVLATGSAVATASLVGLASARGFGAAAAAVVALGLGAAWLNIAANALVSEIYPAERGRMLNLAGMLFGFGALFVPLLVAVAFVRLSVAGTILVCAAVTGIGTASCLASRFPPAHEGSSFSLAEMVKAARHPGVWLFAALIFFESGNEASLSGWTSTYIGSAGWSPRAATIILAGYWVMAIVGRALSARAQASLGKARLVLFSGMLSVAGCLVLLVAARWLPVLASGAWLTALALSAIFQTVLAIAGDRYRRFSGTVFGLLFSASSVGTMVFPWAVGQVSQAAGVRLGMLVPLAGTVAVVACAALVARGEIGAESN